MKDICSFLQAAEPGGWYYHTIFATTADADRAACRDKELSEGKLAGLGPAMKRYVVRCKQVAKWAKAHKMECLTSDRAYLRKWGTLV